MRTSSTDEKPVPFNTIVTVISDRTRWKILAELHKGEPLPAGELAKRLGVPATNISKHLVRMRKSGVLDRGFGKLYRIPQRFFVEGQQALDFGVVVLRLDRMSQK